MLLLTNYCHRIRSYLDRAMEVVEPRGKAASIRGIAPEIFGENVGGAGHDAGCAGVADRGAPAAAADDDDGGGDADPEPAPRRRGRPRKAPSDGTVPVALRNFDHLPDSAFVRLPVVRGLLGDVSAATVWRLSKSGRLPQPVKLSACATAWPVGPLRQALANLSAA